MRKRDKTLAGSFCGRNCPNAIPSRKVVKLTLIPLEAFRPEAKWAPTRIPRSAIRTSSFSLELGEPLSLASKSFFGGIEYWRKSLRCFFRQGSRVGLASLHWPGDGKYISAFVIFFRPPATNQSKITI